MTGKKNYKELENLTKFGTKKFLRRKIEEAEAEEMIRNPLDDDELESVEDDTRQRDYDGV